MGLLKKFFIRSFFGLSKKYYFRQLIFGLFYFVIFCYFINNDKHINGIFPLQSHKNIFLTFYFPCIFIYPYSRFVYESIASFIIGENKITMPFVTAISLKWATMTLCFLLSPIIAPIGLISIFIYHSVKNNK